MRKQRGTWKCSWFIMARIQGKNMDINPSKLDFFFFIKLFL